MSKWKAVVSRPAGPPTTCADVFLESGKTIVRDLPYGVAEILANEHNWAEELLADEHALGAAYLRLREIIGGVANAPHGSEGPEAMWAYTEQQARALCDRAETAERHVRLLRDRAQVAEVSRDRAIEATRPYLIKLDALTDTRAALEERAEAAQYGECPCCHSRLPIEYSYELPPGAYRPDGLQAVDTELLRDHAEAAEAEREHEHKMAEFSELARVETEAELRRTQGLLAELREAVCDVIADMNTPFMSMDGAKVLARVERLRALASVPASEPEPSGMRTIHLHYEVQQREPGFEPLRLWRAWCDGINTYGPTEDEALRRMGRALSGQPRAPVSEPETEVQVGSNLRETVAFLLSVIKSGESLSEAEEQSIRDLLHSPAHPSGGVALTAEEAEVVAEFLQPKASIFIGWRKGTIIDRVRAKLRATLTGEPRP